MRSEERGANEGVRIPVVRASSSFAIAMMRLILALGDVGETAFDRNQELDNLLDSASSLRKTYPIEHRTMPSKVSR